MENINLCVCANALALFAPNKMTNACEINIDFVIALLGEGQTRKRMAKLLVSLAQTSSLVPT